jgi:hypothetical protein
VLGDAFRLVFAADHEAGDVLQEQQRDARWQASSMKCAPFSALSLNRTPLLARIATGMPQICAKPQTSVVP